MRETVDVPTAADYLPNLERTLDPSLTPAWKLIEDLLLEENVTFEQAVYQFETVNMTSPSFIIVGGLKDNEGVVIARDASGVNFTHWLSDDDWFVLQTNRDRYSGA